MRMCIHFMLTSLPIRPDGFSFTISQDNPDDFIVSETDNLLISEVGAHLSGGE